MILLLMRFKSELHQTRRPRRSEGDQSCSRLPSSQRRSFRDLPHEHGRPGRHRAHLQDLPRLAEGHHRLHQVRRIARRSEGVY